MDETTYLSEGVQALFAGDYPAAIGLLLAAAAWIIRMRSTWLDSLSPAVAGLVAVFISGATQFGQYCTQADVCMIDVSLAAAAKAAFTTALALLVPAFVEVTKNKPVSFVPPKNTDT